MRILKDFVFLTCEVEESDLVKLLEWSVHPSVLTKMRAIALMELKVEFVMCEIC